MNATELSKAGSSRQHFVRTFISVIWIYGGRGVGLLWTVVLTSQLGIHDYGQYGMAIAMAGIVGPPTDNPFQVRAIRESEERFLAERTTRFLLALTIVVAGLVIIPMVYFVGFGLISAGGEMALNCIKSRQVRDGHPERVYRYDTARQTTSIVMGSGYLFLVPGHTLLGASLMYCTPYVVIMLVAGLSARKHRPGIPGPPRLIVALMAEMLGTAIYLGGDVLLLGWLTNSTIVGYYTLCFVVGAAIVAVGQSFTMTYHEPLRLSGGALSAGPPLRYTVGLAAVGATLVFLIGFGLLLSPAPTQLAVAMMIMAGFVFLRTVSWVFQAILYTQRRDMLRVTAAVSLVPFKFGLLAALSFAGAVGAAISSTITDAVLLAIFATALYRKKKT